MKKRGGKMQLLLKKQKNSKMGELKDLTFDKISELTKKASPESYSLKKVLSFFK